MLIWFFFFLFSTNFDSHAFVSKHEGLLRIIVLDNNILDRNFNYFVFMFSSKKKKIIEK